MLNSLLSISGVVSAVGSILLAILILLAMITVHEFGHYIVGKILNFKINEFSIGFGPALFSKTSKKTGEKFSVRLIPLGGYCAFEDEDGLNEGGETPPAPEDPFSDDFSPPAPQNPSLHESACIPSKTSSTVEEKASIPSKTSSAVEEKASMPTKSCSTLWESGSKPPQTSSTLPQDLQDNADVYAPLEGSSKTEGSFTSSKKSSVPSDDLHAAAEERGSKTRAFDTMPAGKGKKERIPPQSFCDHPPWKRILVLISGALMNYLLALVIIFISFFSFGQLMLMTYEVEPSLEIASEYCFQEKDVILKANGKDIYLTTDLMNAVKDKEAGDLVEFRVSRVTDGAQGKREEQDVLIQLRRATDFENSADADRLWEALGVAKQTDATGNVVTDEEGNPSYMVYSTSYRFSFFETIGKSFVYSFRIATSIFQVLGELLMGALGPESLGGPITTITITSQIISRGVQPFLEIAAYIGVNLAVFNLLPIPALDGSKVVFTAIEWIKGKPVNRKVEAIIHTIGFLLIFAFAIFVDILQHI